MRIRAIFTGTNKNMGYFTGEEYVLQVLQSNGKPRIVFSEPPAKPVPYASWAAFWNNWKRA